MRNTNTCPKCSNDEIIVLPRLHDSSSCELAAHYQSPMKAGRRWFGVLEALICSRCGYTEMYTRDPRQIPVSEIEGATVRRKPGSGPYR